MTNEPRPCIVKKREHPDRKALFYCFYLNQWVGMEILQGSISGQNSTMLALVEFEDGSVETVPTYCISFLDSPGKFEGYSFREVR